MEIKLTEVNSEAVKIAKKLRGGEILALSGPLGSGKTSFTKALAKELGISRTVTSPTFVLMQQYKGKNFWLYHLDLYRTKNFAEVSALGLEEVWGRKETITVIEWAEKIQAHLPSNTIHINFTRDINAN